MDDTYFAGIIGHSRIKKRLIHWIESDRMPHAVIFSGPSGLGKSLMARAVASTIAGRDVLSHWEEDTDSLIIQDHDDVFYLRPVGSMLKVEQFRLLQEKIMIMGRVGARRICIIDQVETMNKEFANRMLKTLEEPPQGVCFILITSQADLLLPTILSRCALVDFEPVPDDEMKEGLMRLRGGPAEQYDQPVLWGDGNVRAVLSVLAGSGLEGERHALEFLRIMATHSCPYAKWLTLSGNFTDVETTDILRWIGMFLRDILVLRNCGSAEVVRLKKYADDLAQLAPYFTDNSIFQGLQVLDTASEAVSRHVNVRLIWDFISIQFQHIKGGI
jgi:DNA polymerase-3 subunit delta'